MLRRFCLNWSGVLKLPKESDTIESQPYWETFGWHSLTCLGRAGAVPTAKLRLTMPFVRRSTPFSGARPTACVVSWLILPISPQVQT